MLASLGSPDDAEGARRFIPGMGSCFGVRMPILREIAAEVALWGARMPLDGTGMAELLWRNDSREERIIAAKTLERLGKRGWRPVLETAARLVPDIRTWEECDQLGCFGLRFVTQLHPEEVLPRCTAWVRDSRSWTRRFGIVVMTALPKVRGYHVGERETDVLDHGMNDDAREVRDAVGWVLREMAAVDSVSVTSFLTRHAARASPTTRRIILQTLRRLPESQRVAVRDALA
jgi:3-methyladenine DNA glycosylase AlkD